MPHVRNKTSIVTTAAPELKFREEEKNKDFSKIIFNQANRHISQNWKDKINDARIKIISLKTFVTCVTLGFLLSMLACDNNEADFPLAGLSFLVLHKIRMKIKMHLSLPSSLAQITCWGDDSSSSSPSSAHIQLAEWRIPGGVDISFVVSFPPIGPHI